ncbi:MAG: cyclophilin-like fold protein [Bacteroides sp.]|nr:cyclophilin-like fold protein [Bacteroides sp.]MCM1550761.1 cyclophilin-like fold protein [Clostridium sp.]
MKRFYLLFLILGILISATACSNTQSGQSPATERTPAVSDLEGQEGMASTSDGNPENAGEVNSEGDIMPTEQTKTTQAEQEEENNMKMNIQIGENLLTATLVENSSTKALIEMLSEGPVTVSMNDYANMEKVGSLPESLPRNDEQISTEAGDLILYQGNSFVIYYDTNSWSLTRLGKVDNVTQQELKDILGDGSVTAVLSLP